MERDNLRQGILTIQLGEGEVKFTTFIEEFYWGSTELTAMNMVLLVHLSVLLSGIKARNINSSDKRIASALIAFPLELSCCQVVSRRRAFRGRMPTTLF